MLSSLQEPQWPAQKDIPKWCNSGICISEVTNSYLIWIKLYSFWWSLCLRPTHGWKGQQTLVDNQLLVTIFKSLILIPRDKWNFYPLLDKPLLAAEGDYYRDAVTGQNVDNTCLWGTQPLLVYLYCNSCTKGLGTWWKKGWKDFKIQSTRVPDVRK